MTSRDFAYWLQGYFEIACPTTAGENELSMIKKHLEMVFVHEIDPSHGDPEEQAKLNAIHSPVAPPTTMEGIQAYNKKAKEQGGPLMRC